MGEQDSGEKTEEPTPHKLREARKKGQVAKSKEITSAVLIIVSFFLLKNAVTSTWDNLQNFFRYAIAFIGQDMNASLSGHLLAHARDVFIGIMAPLLFGVFVVAIIVELLQTQFVASTDPITPKLEKLNPIEGFKKFFTLKQYVELVKSTLKMAVVIFLIIRIIKEELTMIVLSQQFSLWEMMIFTGSIVMRVIVQVGIFYVIIAILDYMYQHYEYIKGLKMSKKEIKDEYKRLEGDPMIKQRQKETQRKMAQSRQMGAVPGADVVMTNPVHLAIAIKYEHNRMVAPLVLAKGKRLVAQEIKRIAEANNIPIIENPPLVQNLYPEVEIDAYIPSKYYKAVAEILAFVYKLKRKNKQ